MNAIALYFVQIGLTLVVCCGMVMYLRRSLRQMLVDLCRTEERAQFWLVFASIVLVALPLIFGLGYTPAPNGAEAAFFEAANQIKWNLFGFLLALAGIGFVLSFFALFAPRPQAQPDPQRSPK